MRLSVSARLLLCCLVGGHSCCQLLPCHIRPRPHPLGQCIPAGDQPQGQGQGQPSMHRPCLLRFAQLLLPQSCDLGKQEGTGAHSIHKHQAPAAATLTLCPSALGSRRAGTWAPAAPLVSGCATAVLQHRQRAERRHARQPNTPPTNQAEGAAQHAGTVRICPCVPLACSLSHQHCRQQTGVAAALSCPATHTHTLL